MDVNRNQDHRTNGAPIWEYFRNTWCVSKLNLVAAISIYDPDVISPGIVGRPDEDDARAIVNEINTRLS